MYLKFSKYHGAGNDFIIVDARKRNRHLTTQQIRLLCHRKFGIGADGLMLLMQSEISAFKMKYFNSDGLEGTMCGNGGRCITAFAAELGLVGYTNEVFFEAVDGMHTAKLTGNGFVSLYMNDTEIPMKYNDGFFVDTGSPHFVRFVDDIHTINAYKEGQNLRYDKRFSPKGTNVNFVQIHSGFLKIITYERGVEAITLSCGTGAVAAALCYAETINAGISAVRLIADGGELNVTFEKKKDRYINIILSGPAEKVFEGKLYLDKFNLVELA